MAIIIYQEPGLLYANPAAEKITGYGNAELLGMTLGDLLHPDYRDFLNRRAMSRLGGNPSSASSKPPSSRRTGARDGSS